MKRSLKAAFALTALFHAAPAGAITRDEVLTRARAFAHHPWTCSSANLTGTCGGGYQSVYVPGDHVGLAYDWGGYQSLWDYDSQLAAGYAAGSYETDGVLSCTSGLDCSGFVSQAWAIGHHTTSDMATASSTVAQSAMLAGDVFNMAGYHVAMYTETLATGEPSLIEAIGYNVHVNPSGGWAHVSGYTPLRLSGITGTTATVPEGTLTTPIPISGFPYTDQRNTTQSLSRMFDRCGIAPGSNEAGPEYVYSVAITQPGTLTVSVSDDAQTDIDVELFTSLNTEACIARHDSTFSHSVGCGTYYVVADTYAALAGAYTLSATFTPSGQSCGAVSGPPPFNPLGELGDPCQYPSDPSLPMCNGNLGGDTCVYTSSSSFCTKPCANSSDCSDLPGGSACCQDLGKGEFYCLLSSMCGGGVVVGDAGMEHSDAGGGPSGGDGGGTRAGGGADDGGAGTTPGGAASFGSNPGSSSGCGTARAPVGGVAGGLAAGLIVAVSALQRRRRRSSAR